MDAFTSVRKDIVLNESVLPVGTSANFLSLYLSLGYRFFEGKRIMLTPVAGIGYAWVDYVISFSYISQFINIFMECFGGHVFYFDSMRF